MLLLWLGSATLSEAVAATMVGVPWAWRAQTVTVKVTDFPAASEGVV